uniref:Uncharacterized protein n=1 Tax=Bracon brevicornis TaxID=1563983 RepID=A0A6V7JPD5_9HYME
MPDSTCTRLTLKNFNRNVNNPLRVIDEIFKKLRKKLKNDIFKFERNAASSEINAAKNKLRIINRNITKLVSELSLFNNTMIKQYEPWKDSRLNGKIPDDSIEIINLKKSDNSHRIIPLEMECECDSESDRNCDTEPDTNDEEYLPINYSNRLLEFKHKETIDQFCTAKVQTQDKAIQVYDNCSIDYDMKIGYSLLMKADFDPNQNKEVFKPVIIEDPFFDKYEEQFIFYLQSLEEQSCHDDGDEEKENASPEKKSLTDIIDHDLSIEKINEPINEKITFNQPENFDGNVSEIDGKSLNIDPSIDINQLIDLDSKTRNDEAAESEQESPLHNNSEISTMPTNIYEIRHEETATAVEALMEVQPQLNSNLSAHHKRDSNLCDDDDECTILD